MASILRETARIVLRILKHFAIVFDNTLFRIFDGALLARLWSFHFWGGDRRARQGWRVDM
jgi:hypothetical protein